MAKQTFLTGDVLTAAAMTSLQQTAMGGGSTTAKTASYTLVAADAGTVVQMNSASATTITVNTALFAAGDTVQIQNIGAGVCTVTAGTATVNTSATLSLKQYDAGTLYFNTTSAAFFFAVDAADGGTFSGTKIYNTTDQSIANATWTSITFNSETFDTDTYHSTSSNTSRITIPSGKDGKYLLTLTGSFNANATGDRRIALAKNGTRLLFLIFTPNASNYTSMTYTTTAAAVATDYFEMQVYQSSGGSLLYIGGSDVEDFTATYLGA